MRKLLLPQNRKAAGFVIAFTLAASSLGTAVYAAGNVDIPKKNVLQWEKEALSAPETGSGSLPGAPSASAAAEQGVLTRERALAIAQEWLEQLFQVRLEGVAMDKQAEFYDVQQLKERKEAKEQNITDFGSDLIWETHLNKPIWDITLVSPGETKQDVQAYFVTLDATNGDLLKINRLHPGTSDTSSPLRAEEVAEKAAAFVERHGLAKKEAIREVLTYDFGSNKQALLKMDDGVTKYIIFDTGTSTVGLYQDDLDPGLILDIQDETYPN